MDNLKTKFKEWEEWLVGKDINSIGNQIYSMIWDAAVFQSINECRKYASKNKKGEIELNGIVHQFIDKCFFETQALAIRRILDKRRDVISLYRLVIDIKKHSYLLTRKNILTAHDYPYDYDLEKRRISNEVFNNVPSGTPVVMGQDYNKCCISKYTHMFIDSLAGVDSSKRSPTDCIRGQIFKWLEQRLNLCGEIVDFVNDFIAHLAMPKNKNYHKPSRSDVTLGQILEAHNIICQTAIFIGGRMGILSDGHGLGDVLACPQFDQFQYLDKAWASEATIEKLREFWHMYDMQTRDWHNWDWEYDFNKFVQT